MNDPGGRGLEEAGFAPAQVASGRLGMETLAVRLATYLYALPGSVVLARTLGPSGRGSYQVAVTASLIVLTVVLVGLPQSQFRAWGSRSASELLAVSRLAGVVAGLVGLALCLLVALVGWEAFDSDATWALVLIGASMPLQVHSSCLVVLLQSAGRTRRVNVAMGVSGFAQTTGILLLWAAELLTVRTTAGAYVMGLVIQWLLLRRDGRTLGRATPRAPLHLALVLARSGLVLQTFIIAQLLLLRIDVLFIAQIADMGEVGIYAVGVMLAELVWLVTDSLAQAMVERAVRDDEGIVLAVFLRAARMALALGLAAGVMAAVLAPVVVRLLFGRDFAPAAPVIALLMPGILAMGIWRTISPAVVRLGQIWTQPTYAGVALVANVALNVALIPSLGARGAAISSSAAYLLAAALSLRWLLGRTGERVAALRPGREELRALLRVLPGRA